MLDALQSGSGPNRRQLTISRSVALAYKQFPIFPDHRKFFILVLKRHTGAASRALTSM